MPRMVKAVFLHRSDSIYDDVPETHYDFPRQYLGVALETVGDWIVYYEPVKAGDRGYFSAAQIQDVVGKPGSPGRYLAVVARGTYIPFERHVPRQIDGHPFESALVGADGRLARGGVVQRAVRRLPDAEFSRIVSLGLPADLVEREARRYDPVATFGEPAMAFDRPVMERLTNRPYRDALFRKLVIDAYGDRCAISRLRLRNGGGRPEVQAAHIIPVEAGGPDTIRNGLALSGTLHWMFDRGLITVAGSEENYRILISHNKVDRDTTMRLIGDGGRLTTPIDPRHHPHPEYLRWHRENRFGLLH